MRIAPFIALLPIALAACSRDSATYPSLAKRSVEATNFAEPPAAAEPPVQADPALDERIAALTARLRNVAAGFDRDSGRVERAVRVRGARTTGSDAWLEAQTALATLDDWRAQATAVAADAEAAGSARADTLAAPYPALEAVQQAASAELARQDAALTRLQAGLPGG